MIKKIISIKNIGKFTEYNAAGDVELRKLTLIYAENGRGKTTLCDILRSLQTNNADYICGRKTLGESTDPEACIRLEEETASFANGSWTTAYPELAIFDSTFVHDNIYAGDYVDHDHKKNLYRVIVGEEGVRLARRVEELDGQIREANRDIAQKRTAVERSMPSGVTFDAFINLEEDTAVDQKIRSQEAEVTAQAQAGNIKTRTLLKQLMLPSLPDTFSHVLKKQLDDVSEEAEREMRNHIQAHLDERGESWVEQGLAYVRNGRCAFCGQDLEGVSLVQAYRAYFSNTYRDLKREIFELGGSLRQSLGEQSLLRLQGDLNDNQSLSEFWKEFVELSIPPIAFDELRQAVETLRRTALRLVDLKTAAPLELIPADEDFNRAVGAHEAATQKVSEYNSAVERVNELITAKKATTEAGDLLNPAK